MYYLRTKAAVDAIKFTLDNSAAKKEKVVAAAATTTKAATPTTAIDVEPMSPEELKDMIYDRLGFMNIYLKEVGKKPDMDEPLVVRRGSTIEMICRKLHKDFVRKFRYARVWGPSAKFDGQMFKKMTKVLKDGDVLEIHLN